MLGRVIAVIVLIITFSLIYLAPMGLLTRPTLNLSVQEEMNVALVGDTLSPAAARVAADSLWRQAESEFMLPAVLNLSLARSGPAQAIPGFVPAYPMKEYDFRELLPPGFRPRMLPADTVLQVGFPYRGRFSPPMADWKVYRALSRELKKRGWAGPAVLEVYDRENETIRFITVRKPE